MATIPDSTKGSLTWKLTDRARARWPQIQHVTTRFRGNLAYVDAVLADGDTIKLCRLRYTGYASRWGFAIWRASHDDYQDSWLPNGTPSGTPKKPSTPPAASTSATPPPGHHRQRTNAHKH